MPIHEHGKTSWKEVKALQDVMIDAGGSASLRASLDRIREERVGVTIKLLYTSGGSSNVGPHEHTMHISGEDVKKMDEEGFVTATTSLDNGHTHTVKVGRETVEMRAGIQTHQYKLLQCDDGMLCGDKDGYDASHDTFHSTVLDLSPWAFYTDADATYTIFDGGEDAVWQDSSGNGRDSASISKMVNSREEPFLHKPHPAPYKTDVRPDTSSVVCQRQQGLIFPNGSIPSDGFTIFARAKFVKPQTSGVVLTQDKVVRGSQKSPYWTMGWDKYLGVAKYDDKTYYESKHRITDDRRYSYHTVAGRSTGVSPLWVDGKALSGDRDFGEMPNHPDRQFALVVGALDNTNWYGSDFALSDLVIFDRELSDEEVVKISNLMQNREKRPMQCCWDEHMGVKVEQMF